jgi:hypoxanthine phosphoribosyltransferase
MAGPASSHDRIEVIFSAETIAERIASLAREIAGAGLERPLVIPVLTGSFVFSADLLRGLCSAGLSPEVDFMSLASYRRGTTSTGNVDILRDLELVVEGRDVLLIDDILESGKTLSFTRELMMNRGARSCSIAVLLDKHTRRQTKLEADYVGFECPDYFVVGYGMDVAHAFRELPFVGVVRGDA